ncbi:hypothetical protein N9N28_10330 [Rubripirellula amarantea]|nr:hypothetical protein [Rubripirellula amarantea]
MAKHTSERENLLRDATAMPLRGQAIIAGSEVFVGFRVGGEMSLYWDQDPVFQFNSQFQLRRAYVDGRRYAAQNGQICLIKRATDNSHENTSHCGTILRQLEEICLAVIARCDPATQWQVVGETEQDFCKRVRSACETIARSPTVAGQPGLW